MSGPCLFVSYSHKDGKWLEALRTQLEPLELDCDLWHDQRIVPGDRWHREIESALRAAQAAIFLVSPDFLESAFIREHELPALLNGAESRGLRVLCLHVRPSVLAGTGRLKDVYERLRRFQALNDPDRPLSRLSKARQDKALAEIAADIQRAVAPFPVAATPPADSVTPVAFRNMPHGSPDGVFLGRDVELRLLDDAWADTAHTQVVALVAAGGVGKTALVQEWLQRLRADGWRGASRVYAWSFFSQGTSDDRQASDDVFLSEALAWFGVPHEATESAADKGRLLGEELSHQRVLLLLDGVEPLQYPPGPLGGRLRAPGVEALLDRIARVGAPGLVVVTTREALTDLSDCQRNADRPAGTVVAHDVSNLAEVDGARALHRLGVRKAGPAQVAEDDDELRAASREVRGHALTLSLLGKYLALVHDGNVRRRDQVRFLEADAETRGGYAFRVIEAYERWLKTGGDSGKRALAAARLLGLFDRPADPACLDALRQEPPIAGLTEALVGLSETQWRLAVARARECGLLLPGNSDAPLDAHPLVREVLARRLRESRPDAWREGHRRLYVYLTKSTPERPDGLAGLQPLYQAVAHGCHAGLHEQALAKVYRNRILRGTGDDGFYSTRRLGTIGADLTAVACFFDEPWSRLSPEVRSVDRPWLLNQATVRLRAMGRLTDAFEAATAGVLAAEQVEDWPQLARIASNKSGLDLALGRVARAVEGAVQCIDYARHASTETQLSSLTVLADALHQAGRRDDAAAQFASAESRQGKLEPESPWLLSLQGFRYCDLLLAPVERVAAALWLVGHSASPTSSRARDRAAGSVPDPANKRALLDQVEQRARRHPADAALLDIALNHLTLERVSLYRALLAPDAAAAALARALNCGSQAVQGLRAAGMTHHLPRGLLTRAWVRAVDGDPTGAKADLDVAQRIAERGSMRLHLADVHLHRARLFRDRRALASARQLIEECGYHRRDEELRDAEQAAQSWPES